jgi:uroporphyrinogen-III decarboxylase
MDDSIFELVDYFGAKYGDEKVVLFRGIDIYDCLMNVFGGDQEHQLILPLIAPEQIKKVRDYALAYNKKLIKHCAENKVLICMQGKDFGMNTSTIMSPAVIRDIYLPLIAEVNREIAAHGMIPFFHCCGNIWAILDDFAAAGYQGYQSIQETAGMDTRRVKEQYGDILTLWTGIQCETLIEGTLAETEQEVRSALEFLMPGGGFIFGSTNSVQYGAKTDNYLKALEIVREYGIYR